MSGFANEVKGQLNHILCPEDIDNAAVKQLEMLYSAAWTKSDCILFLLDFSKVKSLHPSSYRQFLIFRKQINADRKALMSVNMSTTIRSQVRNDGIESIFEPVKSLQHAIQAAGLKAKQSLNVEFLNVFVNATTKTFQTQMAIELAPGKPKIRTPNENFNVDLASILTLASDQFSGTISLWFTESNFLKIYGAMLGEDVSEINSEIQDAAGEILNIIFGVAKAELVNKKGFKVQKAIPSVLYGSDLRLNHGNQKHRPIILPFEGGGITFILEVLAEPTFSV